MPDGESQAQITTEAARERAEYAERIRGTNERLALSVAALFALTGLLPITLPEHREGVLWTAAVLLVVTLIWFRVVPPKALGDRRVATFGLLLQPVVLVLLSLTGGNDSPYFPYILLPVLVTVYSPSTRHTLFVGAVSAVTLVAVSVVWRYVYHPRFGLLNRALGLFGFAPIDWLGDPFWAMPAIILMAVWKNFGFNMLLFVAALQAIPERLYEAASLDGAGPAARFRYVTLPLLAPTFLFVTVISMIGYFQLFAEPYVMTQGGPANATLSIVLFMYEQGFRWWNMGYATSIAFVLFAIILATTLLQRKLT